MECPGCSHNKFSGSYVIPNQPVILNYRFDSHVSAERVTRRNVHLVQCDFCGLIFNAEFDPLAVPYDSNYENTQCCSPAFLSYLNDLARRIVQQYDLRNKRILEVGCGKGDFLKLLAKLGHNSGDGYDTTYEGPSVLLDPTVTFYREYISASGVQQSYDFVLCRHVIEHVPNIREFLSELRKIAQAAGDPVVLLETPRFEWIFEQRSFWDIFYEHCNYYTESTLRYLCEQAGFQVLHHQATFGKQYQVIELTGGAQSLQIVAPSAIGRPDLEVFRANLADRQNDLFLALQRTNAKEGWGIWGAGAKGVALVNQLKFVPPMFVIDSNPAKQGCVIPGSHVPIIAPTDERIQNARVILVANPQYYNEIELSLKQIAFKNALISI